MLQTGASEGREVPIWDLPVRIVHWAMAALLPALWWTASYGHMDLHLIFGQVMLALVLFRVLWGFVGSNTARFSHFIVGPSAIATYIRTFTTAAQSDTVGHNPLGGLSVLCLLLALALQASLGLFAQDVDAISSGPLNHLVSWETAVAASAWHEIIFNVLLGFVILHIVAILVYRFVLKNNLITAMIVGRHRIRASVAAPAIASGKRALFVAIIAALIVLWINWGLPPWGAYFPWDQAVPIDLSDESYM